MPVTQITNRNVQTAAITGVKLNVLTAKGDLMVYDTVADREAVGTDGQVLIADSTQSTGVRWGSNTATAFQSLASDPGSPAAAAVWYNSTSGTFKGDTAYGVETLAGTLLVSTTQSQTVTSTSQVEFNQVAVIPANTLVAGSTLHIFSTGNYTVASGNSLDFQLRLGSSALLDSAPIVTAVGTNKHWKIDAYFTVLTTGASGTATAGGDLGLNSTNGTNVILSQIGTAINTTVSQNFGLSAAFTNTGDSTAMTYLLIEVLQ
jgi:hypothetical protein